jgi:chromosomal replication initiator protein
VTFALLDLGSPQPVDHLGDDIQLERREQQVTDAGQLWKTCSETLRTQVSDATWRTWFNELTPVSVDEDILVLSAPNTLVRDRIETRFLSLVEDTVGDSAGHPMSVRLRVRIPDRLLGADAVTYSSGEPLTPEPPEESDYRIPGIPAGGSTTAANGAGGIVGASTAALNPRYVFDAFVIGTSNRFAHAAALRVAETPAHAYNPLLIHGASGLGKTHLLHAIGHYVAENFSQLNVLYVSTETFLNDFVDAIRSKGQMAFKRRYRQCDVLLVDDIQFLEGKEGLQEEFFHTFNTLHERGKQIVLSSDRHPRAIATLEDRLRSRFEQGLTTDVQPPELETRLAILRKKAEREKGFIPDEVLELIATNVKDNIRELEGALVRVSAYASLNREMITLDKAELVLSDILDANQPRQITPKVILDATASTFGFTVDELCGASRRRPLVTARQIGMYVFREVTDFSFPAIGREFGGRDHTTVIHAVERITSLMRERRQVYDQVTDLIHQIKGGK